MPRLLLLSLLLACASARAQLLINDDAGRSVVVRHKFTRIVTLAPFLTEAVYAAGAGDLLVGVDALSDYPREAMNLPRVPTGAGFSLDAIAALKPDFVLAYKGGIRMEDVDAMTGFGATVYVAQARHLEDVPRLLQAIGAVTGRDTRKSIVDFEGKVNAIKRANATKPKLAVFLEIWNRPLTTVGGDSLLTEAIGLCRGQNVFDELGGIAPQVSFDEVNAANPYVILGVNSASNAEEFHANWMTHRNILAVQTGRLMYFESETLQRPSVRTVDSISRLCYEMDQLRLHDALIAPSEAYAMTKGPVSASSEADELLRRPMTSVERDVAAVLAGSTYALASPPSAASASGAGSSPAPARQAPRAPQSEAPAAGAQEPPRPAPQAVAANERELPPALRSAPAARGAGKPALEGVPPALRVASSMGTAPARATAAAALPGSYTQVSRYGDLYFVSGQIALDPETGAFDASAKVEDQTRAALENIRRVLEGEHLTMANIVSATVYLRSISELAAMDEAYESAFRTRFPARTVVEATNLPRGARVQIEVVAGR